MKPLAARRYCLAIVCDVIAPSINSVRRPSNPCAEFRPSASWAAAPVRMPELGLSDEAPVGADGRRRVKRIVDSHDRRSLTVPPVATGRRRSNDARPQSPTPAEIDGLTCFRRRATPNGNAARGDTRGPRRHKPRLTLRLICAILVPKGVNKPVERRKESEKGGCYESSRCRSSLGCPAVVLLDRCERQVR